MSYGALHEKEKVFLRVDFGTATNPDGTTYALTVGAGSMSPIVTSSKTGRSFTLSWSDVIAMAIEAGIDQPAAEPAAQPVEGGVA